MARIAFVLDRVFRKFGLSGKSFIPMLIGVGCGVPGVMASRTIENERDRRMTIMTTTFIPCGAKVPFIAMIAGALFGGSRMGLHLRLLHRHGRHHRLRHHAEKDQDVRRRPRSLCYGAACLPLAHRWATFCAACGSAAGPSSRRPAPSSCSPPSSFGSPPTSAGWTAPSGCWTRARSTSPSWLPLAALSAWIFAASGLGQLAGYRGLHHRLGGQGKYCGYPGYPLWRRRWNRVSEHRPGLQRHQRLQLPGVQPAVRPLLRGHRRHQAGDEQRTSGPGSPSAISAALPMSSV